MAPSDTTADSADLRTQVVSASIRLFSENGYEATTVDQIAAAAGVSRRTLFRQFRSKEDMIFADHEALLAQVAEQLAAGGLDAGGLDAGGSDVDQPANGTDPYSAVCSAAEIVFTHFLATGDLAVRRQEVVARVPALRDRELVTTYRYQRVFEEFLRRRLPEESPVHIVGFAAAVTAAHNFLLREMLRGDTGATVARLRVELTRIRVTLGAGAWQPRSGAVAVVSFPAGTDPDAVAKEVRRHLADSHLADTADEQRQ